MSNKSSLTQLLQIYCHSILYIYIIHTYTYLGSFSSWEPRQVSKSINDTQNNYIHIKILIFLLVMIRELEWPITGQTVGYCNRWLVHVLKLKRFHYEPASYSLYSDRLPAIATHLSCVSTLTLYQFFFLRNLAASTDEFSILNINT